LVTALDLTGRIDALREAPAFQTYRYVRERVLRMKELEARRGSGIYEPSDYWREDLANFDYMLDASPLIVQKLRHHCYHITGIRVYDYRSNKDEAQRRFAAKLRSLVEVGGRDLLVPESPALGGFGFSIDGGLYNIDTLKYYEVLIGMREGAILDEFRRGRERRVVWEIGAGWGGFAYQFKTLCPNVTYVISDFPELFLFSAVYLMTVFPGARVVFYDGESADDLDGRWRDADFVFVPNTLLDAVRPERLDLTINMVSFQEMTTGQVEAYVRHAFRLDCPFLYSLNRDRSPYNPQLTSVRSIIRRFYWPHEMSIMPVNYKAMLGHVDRDQAKRWRKSRDKRDLDYKHVIGWKRVLA
jgi:hypothetical protein